MKSSLIIAIDGPSASGKGTLAKNLAEKYALFYVDSGAVYRALALRALRKNIPLEDRDFLVKEAASLTEEDLQNPELRTETVAQSASQISIYPEVREALLQFCRKLVSTTASCEGAVMDGRDVGTRILPEAVLKFYLLASAEVRAQRRYDELRTQGRAVDRETLFQAMRERDQRDAAREHDPMRPAEDAILMDVDALTAEEVLRQASIHVDAYLNKKLKT